MESIEKGGVAKSRQKLKDRKYNSAPLVLIKGLKRKLKSSNSKEYQVKYKSRFIKVHRYKP